VLVWPARADTDTSAALGEVTTAGHSVASFEDIRARLSQHGRDAKAAESTVLEKVATTLETARTAYLEQRFDDMVTVLDALEGDSLAVLALPRNTTTLWETQFRRGLAELSRGDRAQAKRRFALALAIDESRSPRRELYGPDVVGAFAEAADARTSAATRAVELAVTPADALLVIDGTPVVDATRPRSMRPGLHAVLATAPGYATTAQIVEIGAAGPVRIELARASGDAIERIGAAWADGELAATSATRVEAIAAVVVERGVSAALVIDIAADGSGAARLVTASQSTSTIRRGSVAEAARAALARLLPSGAIGSGDPTITPDPPKVRDDSSVLSTWWFWTAVGVATAATVVGIIVLMPDDELHIVPPRP
jgi:hypothetical protein